MRPNVEHQEDPTPDQTDEQTSPQHTNDQTGEMTTEPPTQRVTVAEAARLLGTSAEAVRMRVKRGSLRSTKIKNTVYVLLSPEQTRPNQDQTSGSIGSAANQTSDQTTNETDDRTLLLDSLRSGRVSAGGTQAPGGGPRRGEPPQGHYHRPAYPAHPRTGASERSDTRAARIARDGLREPHNVARMASRPRGRDLRYVRPRGGGFSTGAPFLVA